MHGFLNIHKPACMTSRGVVDAVVALARTRRVGHAGTLDPLATGVLVVCVGDATRLVSQVQDQRKAYRAEFLLGQTSDTDDVSGQVVMQPVAAPPPRSAIAARLPQFLGQIMQVPPQYSAVHVGGRRAHHLARGGATVALPPRTVEIDRLEITGYDYPRLELEIECGSGTYVRALGRDLGECLGCGAVMSRLVRSRIGPFGLETAVHLAELTRESLPGQLLPLAAAVAHLPARCCSDDELRLVFTGRPVPRTPGAAAGQTEPAAPVPGLFALLTPQHELAALARYAAETGLLHPKLVFGGPPAAP